MKIGRIQSIKNRDTTPEFLEWMTKDGQLHNFTELLEIFIEKWNTLNQSIIREKKYLIDINPEGGPKSPMVKIKLGSATPLTQYGKICVDFSHGFEEFLMDNAKDFSQYQIFQAVRRKFHIIFD